MVRRLVIGRHLLYGIFRHCLEEKPNEACGILTGVGDEVLHAYATQNVKRSPVYYEVDPRHQELVLREMEARGEELIGIYHSHPTTDAWPSATDIRLGVHYPDALRVIISLAGPTDIAAFLIRDGQARRVPLEIRQASVGQWHDLRERG